MGPNYKQKNSVDAANNFMPIIWKMDTIFAKYKK